MFLGFFLTVCVLAAEPDIIEYLDRLAELQNPYNKIDHGVGKDTECIKRIFTIIKESWLNEKITCLLNKEELVIEKKIEKFEHASSDRLANLNHSNVAKTFLWFDALRNGISERYFIRAYYEDKGLDINGTNLNEKYDNLSQIASGIKYLHENNITYIRSFEHPFVLSTCYNRTINEEQLRFIRDSYDKLSKKKEEDANKTGKQRKEGFIIVDVQKNEELLKNPISVEESKRKYPKTYVLINFNRSQIRGINSRAIRDENGLFEKYDCFTDERSSKWGETKAIDCYIFGMYINKIFGKNDFKPYFHSAKWYGMDDPDIKRSYLRNSIDDIDTLIYCCTEPDPNKRLHINKIISILKVIKIEQVGRELKGEKRC